MAEVFLMRSSGARGFEKIAVLKRMHPELATRNELVEMFVTEAKLAVHLQHANIVQIHALNEIEGQPCIVMEYVHGRDLHDVLRQAQHSGAPLPVDFGLHCIAEMLKGLHHAHNAVGPDGKPLRLVHRDVTPSNVFISYDGEVKLGDFGVAHPEGEGRGRDIRGKIGYMAPEILHGHEVDHRADLFSAGVVLWETLAQRRLFVGNSSVEVLARIGSQEVEPPSTYNSQVAPDLDQITLRALSKDRTQRQPSALAFEEELSDFLFARRLRWTRRRISDVMQAHYPEESRPLILPARLPRSRRIAPAPPGERPAETATRRMSQAMAGSDFAAEPPPSLEPAWPEDLGGPVVVIAAEQVPDLDGQTLPPRPLHLQARLRTQASPVEMPLHDLVEVLTGSPNSIEGVGVGAADQLDRANFGRLCFWDSLRGFSEPLQAPVAEGLLAEVSTVRLIYDLTVRRMTGLLVLENGSGDRRRSLYFEQGYPLYVCSNQPEDGALPLLLRNKLIESEVLGRGLHRLIGERLPLDAALTRTLPQGEQEFDRLFSAIVRSRLYAAFGWPAGRFRSYAGALAPTRLQAQIPPLLSILVRGVLKATRVEQLEAEASLADDRALELVPGRESHVAALQLRPQERIAVEAMDGYRSVAELLASADLSKPGSRHALLATIYVLIETGLARFCG